MKTRIDVKILSDDSFLSDVCKYVGQNNAGVIEMDKAGLRLLISTIKAKYTSLGQHLRPINYTTDSVSVTSKEDGTPFITLTWVEIHELQPTQEQANNPDDLSAITYPEGLTEKQVSAW